jgi:hypothetical protein
MTCSASAGDQALYNLFEHPLRPIITFEGAGADDILSFDATANKVNLYNATWLNPAQWKVYTFKAIATIGAFTNNEYSYRINALKPLCMLRTITGLPPAGQLTTVKDIVFSIDYHGPIHIALPKFTQDENCSGSQLHYKFSDSDDKTPDFLTYNSTTSDY